MPVTAKLSRTFYDKLGDDIANELVEWFNLVDAQSRSDLRQLLDSQLKEFRADVRADLGGVESRLRGEFDRQVALLEGRMLARFGVLEGKIESSVATAKAGLLRWMFAFWAGSVVTTLGGLASLALLLR